MKGTKIQLSTAEADLMCNAQFILTKNKVIEKIRLMMEELQEAMLNDIDNSEWNEKVFTVSPKISKGENYIGLPYIILDFPRRFLKEDVFAIRNMFWWGNFFSTTLHLTGHSKDFFVDRIVNGYSLLCKKDYYVCINADPWAHHFLETNYRRIETLSAKEFTDILNSLPHIKIAAKQPVDEWRLAASTLFENWKFLLKLLLS